MAHGRMTRPMTHRRRSARLIAAGTLVMALLPSGVTAAEPHAAKPSDFNGDGYADLAIGADQQNVTGGVNVLYGSSTGLSAAGDQFWGLDSPGIPGRRQQIPRITRSISTPAPAAAHSASMMAGSSSWFILATIRAGRPARWLSVSLWISARNRERIVEGATRSVWQWGACARPVR